MNLIKIIFLILTIPLSGCFAQTEKKSVKSKDQETAVQRHTYNDQYDTSLKTIHVFVALCDNKYQGIVPVPEKIGNGQDPDNNLYWGCAFGIRSYFKKSKDWVLLQARKSTGTKRERLIFQHVHKRHYLVADAYDGQYIRQCTSDFLYSSAGQKKDTLHIGNATIGIEGNASLLAYIGHDGLMDFELQETFDNKDGQQRNCIILACFSKKYFAPHLKATQAQPLVWSTGLMAPEAYVLHDALSGYVLGETDERIRIRAAKAYARYQHCSEKAAKNLLVTGW